ncbi:MAG: glycosyltransferase family 4 protein [Micavibrio aeruginosavorus]|uniref:Glycosyltransferase family 4 protein n=1 Tax=Micavibrio aeruginosavorus TaxID=349221 RepID=A0A2W5PMF2_9BACT|nr:MAG: glycosyltransferase family 4 protein [Micavibrio aeruginosavorus]
MRLLFAYRAFDNIAGGVQKTSVDLMNEMVGRGHEVHLLTWDNANATSYFPLHENIEWHKIDTGSFKKRATWMARIQRMMRVRKLVSNICPDVVIGYQDGMFVAMRLYTAFMNVPVIAAERNAASRFQYIQAGKHKNLVFQSFRLAKFITVQCQSYPNDYPAYLRHKIRVISNPVYPAKCVAEPEGPNIDNKILLSVGRLGFQKNYAILVKAFAEIAAQFPDWTLKIIGEGEDRAKLESLIKSKKLTQQILLPGTTESVSEQYCSAHLFCLPSRWEGFPNALAEAMAHGLPCVGLDSCSGVRDLINPSRNGYLAKSQNDHDYKALSETLKKAMTDHTTRKIMGENARNDMTQYDPSVIYTMWENLFLESMK